MFVYVSYLFLSRMNYVLTGKTARLWLYTLDYVVKTEWWGAVVFICLKRSADLHMTELMPLPLTVYCSSKIQIGFTFLVLAHPGCPGQRALKQVLLLLL